MYQYFIALTRAILQPRLPQDGLASPLVLALTCTSLLRPLHLLHLFFLPTLPHFISHSIFTPPTFITTHPSFLPSLLVATPNNLVQRAQKTTIELCGSRTSAFNCRRISSRESRPELLSISHPHPRQPSCDNQSNKC